MAKWIVMISMAVALVACDSPNDTEPKAESTGLESNVEPGQETGQKTGQDTGQADDHDDGHTADDEHFHLGGKMFEISRRFSAIWFAGQSGNSAMVKYQTHELEEVIEEVEEAGPTENGVQIADRLESDVQAHFEALEEQSAAGDKKAFSATYRKVMNNCTVCHADTKHGFIQVKLPEYNPYPNLAY